MTDNDQQSPTITHGKMVMFTEKVSSFAQGSTCFAQGGSTCFAQGGGGWGGGVRVLHRGVRVLHKRGRVLHRGGDVGGTCFAQGGYVFCTGGGACFAQGGVRVLHRGGGGTC